MSEKNRTPRFVPWCVLFTALFAFVGCSGAGSALVEKLDPVTSVTITYCEAPLVFYRDNSGQAAYARNYVNVAPLEVNRIGSFRYFLWLGVWNTIPASGGRPIRDGFESVVLFADGEPLALDLVGWTPDAIGASEPIFLKPAALAADAYYEVTLDQIRLISESRDLRLQTTGAAPRRFELWDDQKAARKGLAAFLQHAHY